MLRHCPIRAQWAHFPACGSSVCTPRRGEAASVSTFQWRCHLELKQAASVWADGLVSGGISEGRGRQLTRKNRKLKQRQEPDWLGHLVQNKWGQMGEEEWGLRLTPPPPAPPPPPRHTQWQFRCILFVSTNFAACFQFSKESYWKTSSLRVPRVCGRLGQIPDPVCLGNASMKSFALGILWAFCAVLKRGVLDEHRFAVLDHSGYLTCGQNYRHAGQSPQTLATEVSQTALRRKSHKLKALIPGSNLDLLNQRF